MSTITPGSASTPPAKRSNLQHFSIVGVLTLVIGVLTYFVLLAVFGQPVAASTEAIRIDEMINVHYYMIAALFAIIVVPTVYCLYAFRAQPGDYSDGEHIHGNNTLEALWIAIPTVIVLLFGVYGFNMLREITAPAADEYVIEVTAFQFGWRFHYPESGVTSDDLYVPIDRQILLEMNSIDVLHSFWVPEFRVKQDLVPGLTTTLRITPNVAGEYMIRCAEICGVDHYKMLRPVHAMPQADFDAWMAEQVAELGN